MRPFLLLILLVLMSACGKIELPSDDKTTDKEHPTDTVSTDKVYAVSELASVADDEVVYVKGYIVGYIPKNGSMARAVFEVDENVVASNVIIADASSETDYQQCVPVQLLANSEARIALNLADNPENLGALVILQGKKQKYYNSPGLKPVYFYQFVEEPPSKGDDDDPSTENPFPTLNRSEAEVFEGC